MKRHGFLVILFFVLVSLLVKPVFAESVSTGNATAKSRVETKIESSGSVTTRIEVGANGEKKVLDANEPGSYSVGVESKSDLNEVSPSSAPSGKPNIGNNNGSQKTFFISAFAKNIRNFFKNFLSFL